jgi:hypothetical protein
MKRFIITFLTGALLFAGQAQNSNPATEFKFNWGVPFEIPKKYEDLAFLSNMQDGIIQVCGRQTTDIIIQRIDLKKLMLTSRITLDLSKKPDHYLPDLFTRWDNDFYMLYSVWDKEAQKEHLFADKMDLKSGAFAETPKELILAKKITGELIGTGFYKFSTANKYKFNFSIDSSFLLVTYRLYTNIKNDAVNHDMLGFHVFNKNLDKIWGGEFRMPYTEEIMDNTDFAVDTKGNAYLLCKVYQGKRTEQQGGNPNYHYEILKFTPGNKQPSIIKVRPANKFINNIILTEGFGGEMICAGFYKSSEKLTGSAPGKYNSADGSFIIKIDENDSLVNISKGFYEFPAEIIKAFERPGEQDKVDKKESKQKAEIPGMYLRKILFSSDGSIIFAGEQYLHTSSSSMNSSGTIERDYYLDIYVMKIDPQGELSWVRKIPKNQEGARGRRSMSFKYYYDDGNSYFFFLDNIKNLGITQTETPAKHIDGAGGFLTVCKIDRDGNLTKGNLINLKEVELQLWPADFDAISDKILLGRGIAGETSKLLKIEHIK